MRTKYATPDYRRIYRRPDGKRIEIYRTEKRDAWIVDEVHRGRAVQLGVCKSLAEALGRYGLDASMRID